jgi:transcriptional regulator with XRE-family HTH domain
MINYSYEIRQRRKENTKTQTEIAQKTGIPQNTISWIEKGKGIPNIEQCIKLADYYHISVDELIGHEIKNNF